MPDSETPLFEKFKLWAYTPNTTPQQSPDEKDIPAAQDALEAGLWAAYRAGYQQALRDSEAVQRVVDFSINCMKEKK